MSRTGSEFSQRLGVGSERRPVSDDRVERLLEIGPDRGPTGRLRHRRPVRRSDPSGAPAGHRPDAVARALRLGPTGCPVL